MRYNEHRIYNITDIKVRPFFFLTIKQIPQNNVGMKLENYDRATDLSPEYVALFT